MSERDDRELDDYLRGGSPLSAAYRKAPGEEPSANLDEVLLEKARREVHLGPKVAWSPFTRAWSWPLRLVAVLVVSVTVTLVMYEQTGEPLPIPAKPVADAPVAAPEPAPAKAKALAPEGARTPAAPAPFPAEKSSPALREERAPAAEAPARTAGDTATAASAEGPAAAPVLQDAPGAQRLEKKAAEAPARRARQEAAKQELTTDRDLGADPEAWVRRIAALRNAGRHAEADELLAEFRKRFPEYPAERLPK